MAEDSRWLRYRPDDLARVHDDWRWETLAGPSRLFGANGMTFDPSGRLCVTQVFGSQVTAIDVATGAHQVLAGPGAGVRGPDDGICSADGTFFATEPVSNTVSRLGADGAWRTVRDDLPAVNGITMDHQRRRLFVDEFRPGGRLLELDPDGTSAPRVLLEDLNGPNAFAMGPDGKLYFPQVFANEIWCYDLDERKSSRFAADLQRPTAVKFDSLGRIVTSEAAAGRITAIDVATGARTTLANVPPGIDNVSVGNDDRLFVSHFDTGMVAEVTGGVIRMLSEPGFCGPYGLQVSSDGSVLVADGLSIAVVRNGTSTRIGRLLIELPGGATSVASALDGTVVMLTMRGTIMQLPPGGGQPATFVELQRALNGPSGLVADPAAPGAFLVCERESGTVSRIGLDGGVEAVTIGLRNPLAAARGRDGTMWVTQSDGVVAAVRPDGTVQRIGGFVRPEGIAANGAQIAVADAGARCVALIDDTTGGGHRGPDLVAGAPLGSPDGGNPPLMFAAVAAHPFGGFVVGCNGDGAVRWLRPR